ncbi:DUF2769 domain-containing protein [Methanogenium sp. S4BF]|uniref:DUF2769 domain-containing protein n=1 Tax=Methanogenium sp. S4BF TaxID=1789226 RepID=UPI0024162AEC|nr:DUF2769 domain-containing protein [Methanogenium sp. S4BF]WFN33443.1 DUF2769 domain-containing protein [Methanogenium sp. S4BF]
MALKAATLDEVLGMCICMTCPSWVNCGEKGGYCVDAIGKSACIHEEKGCVCRNCQAFKNAGLKHISFCTKGSADEQSKM